MSLTPQERAKREDFDRQYRQGQLAPVQAVERAVCGCDYGGTSWATRDEADRIAAALELGPHRSLLEIGAGSGWPGLYLARHSGCRATLTDLPPGALEIAMQRARQDGIAARCTAVVADAAQLPFPAASFDAINHSDVLCCLVQKHAVLAECRRVIRPTGRMAFSVIYIAAGLSPQDHAEAADTAPEFAETDIAYPDLIAATGWGIRARHDLTPEFTANCREKIRIEENLRAELEPLTTAAEFDARQTRMRRRIDVLERGHMRRELFVVDPL
ncbi:MAG TPA: class I SAM-dependent methyltransferase [Thermohalobaculum sp.]|nr:class I SAM-dependent methyltransferase [Thermohalobaculum sp.]